MRLIDLRNNFFADLLPMFAEEEVRSFLNILLNQYFDLSPIAIALEPQKELEASSVDKFLRAKERLKKNEPIQYILGQTEFYGLVLKVNPYTLIPRPETEELVEWIVSENKSSQRSIRILDIGTGSGCIAIALAKNIKSSEVAGIDISSGALEVAMENAQKNEVTVNFRKVDILYPDPGFVEQNFDIIVSNPPYVRMGEKHQMHSNVLDYEPHTALFVKDEDPLLFYRVIAAMAKKRLNPGGKLFFEINEAFKEEMIACMKEMAFSRIIVRQDMYGKYRMLRCQL